MIGFRTPALGSLLAATVVAGLSISGQASAACPTEPRLTVAVVAEYHPPVVRSSYSFAQLRSLAASAGYRGPHAPFGLYAGSFGYTVEITDEEVMQPGCKQAMRVQVGMILGDRLVEVGTDIPCRPETVLSHYLLHAERDDELLRRYADRALAMFDRMPTAKLLGMPAQDMAREAVTGAVRSTMDGLLQSYDDDRKQALAAADSDAELLRLRAACGRDA